MSKTFIDIGTPNRIVLGSEWFVETEKGVFLLDVEKCLDRARGMAMVYVNNAHNGIAAWGMSPSMSFLASLASRAEEGMPVEDVEIPLLSDEEGWKYMLEHDLPVYAEETSRLYEDARWVDLEGRAVGSPDWFRGFSSRLLNHRGHAGS